MGMYIEKNLIPSYLSENAKVFMTKNSSKPQVIDLPSPQARNISCCLANRKFAHNQPFQISMKKRTKLNLFST